MADTELPIWVEPILSSQKPITPRISSYRRKRPMGRTLASSLSGSEKPRSRSTSSIFPRFAYDSVSDSDSDLEPDSPIYTKQAISTHGQRPITMPPIYKTAGDRNEERVKLVRDGIYKTARARSPSPRRTTARQKTAKRLTAVDEATKIVKISRTSEVFPKADTRSLSNSTNRHPSLKKANSLPQMLGGSPNSWTTKWDDSESAMREKMTEYMEVAEREGKAEMAALSGGTDRHRPWRKVATLPVHLGGMPISATPDTGSDSNAVSAGFAVELGLQIDATSNRPTSFQLANGREVRSIGIVSTTCTFSQGSNRQGAIPIVFNVFVQLAVPIIIGMEFLQATETLTKYSDRLIISLHQTPLVLPRILHLNRPQQRLRCYLGINLVYANADTGAEMNLMSSAFAAQRGFRVDRPDSEHQEVVLADGSRAPISGKLHTRFYTFEKPPREFTSGLRAAEKEFYILDGLTTDVLLGNDLLFEISAFSEHQTSFVDLRRLGIFSDLNLVTWLSRREKRLLNISNGQASPFGRSMGRASGLTPGDASASHEVSFQIELDDDDAREQYLRQATDLEIARLSEPARSSRKLVENNRRRLFDENRLRLIQEHDRRMAAMAQHSRVNVNLPGEIP